MNKLHRLTQKIGMNISTAVAALFVAGVTFQLFRGDPQWVLAAERFFLQTSGVATYFVVTYLRDNDQ